MRNIFIFLSIVVFVACKSDEQKLTNNYFELNGKAYPLSDVYIAKELSIADSAQYRLIFLSPQMELVNAEQNFYTFTPQSSGSYIVITFKSVNNIIFNNGLYNIYWGEVINNYNNNITDEATGINSGTLTTIQKSDENYLFEFTFTLINNQTITGNFTGKPVMYTR